MNSRQLLRISTTLFEARPKQVKAVFSPHIFTIGAQWMAERMGVENPSDKHKHNQSFIYYGLLKYGICFGVFLGAFFLFWHLQPWLIPLSILVFYLCEIHFLFLFPLLIDQVPRPVCASVRMTYRMGLIRTAFTVMHIGFFMVSGLFQYKNPFKKWHIGCLAIVIWYQYEVRNRLPAYL